MITKEQIETLNKIKRQIKVLKEEQDELSDLFKKEVQANKGDAIQVEGYTVTVKVGQQTRLAGHEKFKEILGEGEYNKMFEVGLINIVPTATLKVDHE